MKLQTKQTSFRREPVEVFSRLVRDHEYCFLLETLADEDQPQTSGESYIGVAPKHHFAAENDRFYADGQEEAVDNPFTALRSRISFDKQLPKCYRGGLVGYFSHEAMCYQEPTLDFPYPRDFFDFQFGEYEDGLVFKDGQPTEYFYYNEDRQELYRGKDANPGALSIDFAGRAKTEPEYHEMVERAREDIRSGRVFQVVLANKYEYRFSGDLLELYKELRRINPSPFMFFLKFGDVVTMGASPELLAHTAPEDRTYLEALAGTIGRGKTPAEDAALARKLLQDEKEIAEHNMLVDLYRNDVGRVSRIGSVRIDSLKYIKKLSHVQHICSLVSGELAEGKDAFSALAAAFPAGTLVGTPKIEAAKMIAELEDYERGPYGGSVGYFSYSGDSMHAVNIRSVSTVGDKLFLHTGSGIVYDSRPGSEYQEISSKKTAMDMAMKLFLRRKTL
jgi:anthranilate synthase component 1